MTNTFVPHLERSAELPPLYRQAVAALERLAMSTPLDSDRPLPPESQLAASLAISRGTLRRATEELARQGLLVIQAGRGTFVNKHAQVRRIVWQALRPLARPDSRFDLDITAFIPDFEGGEAARKRALGTAAVRAASTVFVAPDNSLTGIRRALLEAEVRLLVPSFGGRRGIFLLENLQADARAAATLDGMEELGHALTLAELEQLGRVELLITGAVAVTRGGVHVGGGEGHLDLEWGLLRELGLVDDDVPVMAVVHEVQFLDAPLQPKGSDCLIDIVVTPQRVVELTHGSRKPTGLDWEWSLRRQAAASPYLQELMSR